MSVDVRGEDDAFRIPPPGDEDAQVTLDRDIHFFEFTAEDAEKGIFRADDRRLADELLEDLKKISEVGVIGGRHGNFPGIKAEGMPELRDKATERLSSRLLVKDYRSGVRIRSPLTTA